MKNRRATSYIFFCFVAVVLIVGVWSNSETYETSAATAQLLANNPTYQIAVTQSAHGTIVPGTTTVNFGVNVTFYITPDAGYHIASITANGETVTVTNPAGQAYQFSRVSANGKLTATFAFDPPSLGLVIAAVIIVAAMILIYKLPENKYKTKGLTTYEKQEIAAIKKTVEKIRTLEEEKQSLQLEIEQLKKKKTEANVTA